MMKLSYMKMILVLLLVVVFMGVLHQDVQAGIVGSRHDLSTQSWNTTGEICIVCHTPHNADSSFQVPLWNHQTTASSFTMYTSPTLDAMVGVPDGTSKACLSCHDGTVAINAFGGRTGSVRMIGDRLLGTDLSNDHPVSFTYDAALAIADGELVVPQDSSTVDGVIQLFNGKVECASCHDVHNTFSHPRLLVKSNARSALCLTCHQK